MVCENSDQARLQAIAGSNLPEAAPDGACILAKWTMATPQNLLCLEDFEALAKRLLPRPIFGEINLVRL